MCECCRQFKIINDRYCSICGRYLGEPIIYTKTDLLDMWYGHIVGAENHIYIIDLRNGFPDHYCVESAILDLRKCGDPKDFLVALSGYPEDYESEVLFSIKDYGLTWIALKHIPNLEDEIHRWIIEKTVETFEELYSD